MKEGIHPKYRDVVFMDVGADFAYLTKSTVRTKDTIAWKDGKEYPPYKVAISSASHPFYTGKQKFVDSAGRIEKFRQRYQIKDAAAMLEALEKKKEELKKRDAEKKAD